MIPNRIVLTGIFLTAMVFTGCFEKDPAPTSILPVVRYNGGSIYFADGTPASRARVHIYSVTQAPQPLAKRFSSESSQQLSEQIPDIFTDTLGHYRLDHLPNGVYNILAESGKLRAFRDSITVPHKSDWAVLDTLQPTGKLFGQVFLSQFFYPGEIRFEVTGTGYSAKTDSLGKFSIEDMAAGEYPVRILSVDSYVIPQMLNVRILTGKADSLAVNIPDPVGALGTVFKPNGRPEAFASIVLTPYDFIPGSNPSTIVSITADSNGHYPSGIIAQGRYTISYWPGRLTGPMDPGYGTTGRLRDSVTFPLLPGHFLVDTLQPVGSLKINIRLQPQQDPQKVNVQLMGMDSYYHPDSAGVVWLGSVLAGSYRLRIVSSESYYVPLLTTVHVRSRKVDTLPELLKPIYTGIPVVGTIELASFDTANSIATLSWHRPDWPILDKYLVFADISYGWVIDNPTMVGNTKDTLYADTIYPIDKTTGKIAGITDSDSLSEHRVYEVAVQGQDGQRGVPWGNLRIDAPSPFFVRTGFAFHLVELPSGTINYGASIHPGDSLRIDLSYHNPTRKNIRISVFDGDTLTTSIHDETLTKPAKDGGYSFSYRAPTTPGKHLFFAKAWDDGNAVWWGKLELMVQ